LVVVYHVFPVSATSGGGAAQFATVLKQERATLNAQDQGHITLFSGDAFNPSLESAISKGKHMLPVLKSLEIDAAVYGNRM
jgi:2',3'-cyclic-nucleotide 2'-phosphodiesterase (5'-nucleotidase family)